MSGGKNNLNGNKYVKNTLICKVKDNVMECIDYVKGKKAKYRKTTYLSIKPEILASTITAEKVGKWLDEKGLRSIVIEHPSLLSEEERKELEKVIGSKDIYTYTTAWVQEVER